MKKHGEKLETHFYQAATEIAKEMSDRHGRKVSPGTLIVTLATQRGEFYTDVRRLLNKRMQQLKRESQRNAKAITTPQHGPSEAE